MIVASTGNGVPQPEEPLTGMFIGVPQPHGAPFCFNTLLCLSVTTFDFQSAHFTVVPTPGPLPGSVGQIATTTFFPDSLSMSLGSSINGQPILLNGGGAFDPNSPYPPAFSDIEICGAPPGVGGSCAGIRAGTDEGYVLTISAAPATQTPTPTATQSATPTCGETPICGPPLHADCQFDQDGCPRSCFCEGPTPVPTSTPSPTPTPAVEIRYRLTSGSTILFTPSMPGSAQIAAPLSGAFTVFRSQNTPPNTFIGLTIAHIDFQGGSQFVVTDGNPMPNGCAQEVSLGCILALTVEPNHVYVFALVSINADSNLGLVGGVWTPPNSPPSDLPTFNNLELCGGPLDRACDAAAISSGAASGYVLTIFAMPEG